MWMSDAPAFAGVALALLLAGEALAQPTGNQRFQRDCQRWIEQKGYSTDYIEQKLGKRQPGLAGSWRGNVTLAEVAPGDVALIRFSTPGALHAALVERVRRNDAGQPVALQVSEWNWGKIVEPRCLVTENFGRLAPTRWAAVDSVAHVWRPDLPLQ